MRQQKKNSFVRVPATPRNDHPHQNLKFVQNFIPGVYIHVQMDVLSRVKRTRLWTILPIGIYKIGGSRIFTKIFSLLTMLTTVYLHYLIFYINLKKKISFFLRLRPMSLDDDLQSYKNAMFEHMWVRMNDLFVEHALINNVELIFWF